MDWQLRNKVAVITGAAKGMGTAIVRSLIRDDAQHVLSDANRLRPLDYI